MRRKEREITALLKQCQVMRVAMCDGDMPYIVPMNFGMEETGGTVYLYFHCAHEGKKLDILRRNPNVCFETDANYDLVTGEVACQWTAHFASVIGFGKMEIISEPAGKKHGLDMLMAQHGFGGLPEYSNKMVTAVTVLRQTVESMTGKRAGK